jgi:hypothetical protein
LSFAGSLSLSAAVELRLLLAVALRDFRRAAVELALRSPLHFGISLRCRGAAAALAVAFRAFR